MPTYGLGATAQNLLNQPYGGISPFAPAGMTDAQRQGMLTTLQGMGSQYAPSQMYAQQMQGLAGQTAGAFNQGMANGSFQSNDQMRQAAAMAGNAAGGNGYMSSAADANRQGMQQDFGQSNNLYAQSANQPGFGASNNMYGQSAQNPAFGLANNMYGQSAYQPGFGASNQMYGQSAQQPGFGQSNQMYGQSSMQPMIGAAAGLAGNTMGQYGGGYSTGMADTINSTGASFDPFNNPAIGRAISAANSQLGQDFRHNTMPAMNRAAAGSGSGGYGGSRAGVAQGIREAGLATAMGNSTANITSDAYESGLNRYVQDRGQTVNATLEALKSGGWLGMQGAQTLGNLGQMQGNLQQGAASGLANNAANQGALQQGAASGWANNAANQGALQQGAASGLVNSAGTQGGLQQGAASGWASNAANQGALQQGAASGIGSNTQNQANNYLQAGSNLGSLGLGQMNAQLGAANQIGALGQFGLGQSNSMMSNFYGNIMPGAVGGAYQAGMAPGNVMQGMGNQLSGYGNQQQANNQAMVDWQNQAFNHAQQYPQSQFANYAANITPLTGTKGTSPQQGPQQTSPWTSALGGASAGYGLYDAWNKSQNQQTGVAQGSGQLPGGAYGNLPGTYGYGGATMPQAPAVGGFGY